MEITKKEWSGERLETHIFTNNTIEHLHRYAIACDYVKDKIVLDIASGEGYGSNLLSKYAKHVTGVDISEESIILANKKYNKHNLIFKNGSTSSIPLDNYTIDVVVSFETIEHHDEHDEMMKEIKRVLKPNGVLILSTPDKKYYSDIPKTVNPHHVKELYLIEFKDLVKKYFNKSEFFYQKMFSGSIIKNENRRADLIFYKGNFENVYSESEFNQIYVICVASDYEFNSLDNSVFDGSFVLQRQFEDLVKKIQNTWSFRIGNFLIYPFKRLKNLISK